MYGLAAAVADAGATVSRSRQRESEECRDAERTHDGDPSNQLTSQARIRRGLNRSSRAVSSSGSYAARLVGVLGPSVAALARRLPRVLGVPELTLRELVETFLLAPQEVEFVLRARRRRSPPDRPACSPGTPAAPPPNNRRSLSIRRCYAARAKVDEVAQNHVLTAPLSRDDRPRRTPCDPGSDCTCQATRSPTRRPNTSSTGSSSRSGRPRTPASTSSP